MLNIELARERRQARLSTVFTLFSMLFVAAMYFQRLQWLVFLYTLSFMAGCVFDRLQLSRTIRSLLGEGDAPSASGAT